MSAYLHQKNTGGFTIAQGPIYSNQSGAELGLDPLSSSQSVPHIMSEIENFVTQFKHAESALIQERTKSLQIWQELRDLRTKFERAKLEYEEKIAEKLLVQDQLQSDLGQSREREEKLTQEIKSLEQKLKCLEDEKKQILEEGKKSQWSAVNQERERTHQYYNELKKLYSQYCAAREKWIETQKAWTLQMNQAKEKHSSDQKKMIQVFTEDKAKTLEEKQKLLSEISRMNEQIKNEKDRIQSLSLQIRALQENEQKVLVEKEHWRKKLDLFKTKLLPYYHGYRKAHAEVHRLRAELEKVQNEKRTGEVSQEELQGGDATAPIPLDASVHGHDRGGVLEEERKRRQALEDLLDQERKAKELALEELRSSEDQRAQVCRELQNLKEQWLHNQGIVSEGLELRF